MTPADEIFREPSRLPLRLAGIVLSALFVALLAGVLPLLSTLRSAATDTARVSRPRQGITEYSVPPLPPTLRVGTADRSTQPAVETPASPRPAAESAADVTANVDKPPASLPEEDTLLLLPEAMRIKDPHILASLTQAEELRQAGDPPAAMETLRALEDRIPDHPLLLYQFAETADALGLSPLAMDYWNQLKDLGESVSGDFAAYADMKLHYQEHTIDSAELEESLFQIGPVRLVKEIPVPGVEGVNLSIPVKIRRAEMIDIPSLEVYVYFFERLPNGQIVQSDSEENGGPSILYRWQKNPDWRAGPETLEVEYRRPLPDGDTPHRHFHGYIIRVFYQSRLQDVTARPRTLFDIQLTAPPQEEESLEEWEPTHPDEPMTPGTIGPDPSLFPRIQQDSP